MLLGHAHCYQDLFEKIDGRTWIITANKRLANQLASAYGSLYQSNEHDFVLFDNPIRPLNDLWHDLWESVVIYEDSVPFKLSAKQADYLWYLVIQHVYAHDKLFNKLKTTDHAIQAWKYLNDWLIEQPINHEGNANAILFLKWLKAYQSMRKQIMVRNGLSNTPCIDDYELGNFLINHTRATDYLKCHQIIYVGFDTLTPLFQRFLYLCSLQGIESRAWSLETHFTDNTPTSVTTFSKAHTESQFQQVVFQIKSYCERFPQAQIGVICHDLQMQRARLKRLFDHTLLNDSQQKTSGHHTDKPYTISGGDGLAGITVIDHALRLLNLKNTRAFEDFSILLASPYILGYKNHLNVRLAVEQQLRTQAFKEITLDQLPYFQALKKLDAPLHDRLIRLIDTPFNVKQSWSQHFEQIVEMLHFFGWPGQSLSSHDYQAVKQFYEILSELPQYNLIKSEITYHEALTWLNHLVREKQFQPESNATARIHILGHLEASQLYFDHTWLVNMGEFQWPDMSAPNPYLPLGLQKMHHMPHATVERELEVTKSITKRMLSQAQSLTISFSHWYEQNQQKLSPLIQMYLPSTVTSLSQDTDEIAEAVNVAIEPDCLAELQHDHNISGGSELLKSMAQCPFRAQLKYRLNVEEYAFAKMPFNPLQKGIMVHRILYYFYNKIGCSQQLTQMTDQKINDWLTECIQKVISDYNPILFHYQPVLELEKERLYQLIRQWVDHELTRANPFKIAACEQKIDMTINGVTLTLKVDRVDHLACGSYVVIDYKTSGNLVIKNWFDQRVSEPQLPLYALYFDADAIAYAQINANKISFHTLGCVPDIIKANLPEDINKTTRGVFTSWQELKAHWRKTFQKHISDFKTGDIAIRPGKHCNHCSFMEICRYDDYEIETS